MPDWLFWITTACALGALELFVGFRGLFGLLFAVNALLLALLSGLGLLGTLFSQILMWVTVSSLVSWLFHRRFARYAYNFEVVIPGKLYRSAKPDSHFIRYLKNNYDVQQIVSLIGPVSAHNTAARLGIDVHLFQWRWRPSLTELQAALALLDNGKPTLVHCRAGRDRTGLLIAAHHITQSGWSRERALLDMIRLGHDPKEKSFLHVSLDEVLAAQARLS